MEIMSTYYLGQFLISLSTIETFAVLAIFLPIIAGQGGNAGMQTVTVIIRDMALGGHGVARLATFLVGPDIAAGRLVELLTDWRDPQEIIIHAVYPSRRLVPPATRAFVDFLVEKMMPAPPWAWEAP